MKSTAVISSTAATSVAGMIECVPSFTSLAVYYNVYEVWKGNERSERSHDYVRQYIKELCDSYKEEVKQDVKHISIPVCYGGEYESDLEESRIITVYK